MKVNKHFAKRNEEVNQMKRLQEGIRSLLSVRLWRMALLSVRGKMEHGRTE